MSETPPVQGCRILARHPHDPDAFTQGLLWRDGRLYESTGFAGRSTLREVDLETGRVLRSVAWPADAFGEGIAGWEDEIVGLSWRDGFACRWDRETLQLNATAPQPGEGWGLTGDGRHLIMSDGTPVLRFLDPATLREERRLTVVAGGRPVYWLNALQWAGGELLANILAMPALARIDSETGKVRAWIDLRELVRESGAGDREKVANGIAWDVAGGRLFVTGKNWPWLYRIELLS